jgi:hypothetical protein
VGVRERESFSSLIEALWRRASNSCYKNISQRRFLYMRRRPSFEWKNIKKLGFKHYFFPFFARSNIEEIHFINYRNKNQGFSITDKIIVSI